MRNDKKNKNEKWFFIILTSGLFMILTPNPLSM
jgi:hypothetical protein